MDVERALAMEFESDIGFVSLRYYLQAILMKLWQEGECFSGKRPLGNSGWQWDIYAGLIENKLIDGTTVGGYPEDFDQKQADKIILAAIEAL